MKKLTPQQIKDKLNIASLETGYVYTYTGQERQQDKIIVYCPKHKFEMKQIRQNATDCRKIDCCNPNGHMIYQDFIDICNRFDGKATIKLVGKKFKGYKSKVRIKCPKHGTEVIKLESLMHKIEKEACRTCSHIKHNRKIYPKEKWIEMARKIHGDTYDYSAMEETGEMRTIICHKHGKFPQSIYLHIHDKNGCPSCVCGQTSSKPERELQAYFDSLGLIKNEDYLINTRAIITPKEIDIYFPKLKLGIEYNGGYYHTDASKSKNYHKIKKLAGMEKDVNIIMIYEHQWKHVTQKNIILHLLKTLTDKTHDSKIDDFIIKEVSKEISVQFHEENHIKGYMKSDYNLGLYKDDVLTSLMTFKKSKENTYKLIQYSSLSKVIGGEKKLFDEFIKIKTPTAVSTIVDLDWSYGQLENELGFIKVKNIKPSFVYIYSRRAYTEEMVEILEMDRSKLTKCYNSGFVEYQLIPKSVIGA